MPLPPDFLRKLDAKRGELNQLRHRITVMEAEVRGWEEAALALDASHDPVAGQAPRDGPAYSPPVPPRPDSTPSIRRSWQSLLRETAKHYPADVSLDDMERMSVNLGDPTTRNTLRSQMSTYAARNLVERTRQGRYRLTRAGADALGIQLPMPQASEKPTPVNLASDLLDASGPVAGNSQNVKEEV